MPPESMPDALGRLSFGPFSVDLRAGELFKGKKKIKVQQLPLQVLGALLERPGEVVEREELKARLWPADTFVDFEHGLNTAIKKLRQALSDSTAKPRYIETLPKKGYRFTGKLQGEFARPAARRARLAALAGKILYVRAEHDIECIFAPVESAAGAKRASSKANTTAKPRCSLVILFANHPSSSGVRACAHSSSL